MKLTETQKKTLEAIGDQGVACAYELRSKLGTNVNTMRQLQGKGLIGPVGPGHMFSPATGDYALTRKGRAFLELGK